MWWLSVVAWIKILCAKYDECLRIPFFLVLCFQTAKRSDIGFADMQGGLFAHCQEWYFQAAKRSDKSSSTMQEGILLMLWISVFRIGNFYNMGSAVQQWGWIADSQESRFQAAKRSEMCTAFPQGRWFVDAHESRIQVCETFKLENCRHKRNSICWYSGIVIWGLETFTYGLCCPVMWSICMCTGIAF